MKDCGSLQRAQKGRETCPFRALDGFNEIRLTLLKRMAGTTRLELATSAVTGQRSNQLNYVPAGESTTYRKTLQIRPLQDSHTAHRSHGLPAVAVLSGRTAHKLPVK